MAEDELSYMEEHPPSCVAPNVGAASAQLRNLVQGDYGSNTTVFGLRCSCGGDLFEVSLPDQAFGLVFIRCAGCCLQRNVFNPLEHGYDGALGNNKGVELRSSSTRRCPKCDGGPLLLAAGFQYSGETDILVEQDLDIKPEDLFGWFVLSGKCTSCGAVIILADVECA
jgi:hypothetical protein